MAVSGGKKNQTALFSSREFAAAHEVVIPGLEFLKVDTGSIGDILDSLYKFGLGFVGIAALAMFTISGVQYMFAGEKDPTNAKKRMVNAIFGLVLAFTSWLILYEINPALVGKLRVFGELEKLETPPLPTNPEQGVTLTPTDRAALDNPQSLILDQTVIDSSVPFAKKKEAADEFAQTCLSTKGGDFVEGTSAGKVDNVLVCGRCQYGRASPYPDDDAPYASRGFSCNRDIQEIGGIPYCGREKFYVKTGESAPCVCKSQQVKPQPKKPSFSFELTVPTPTPIWTCNE